MPAVSSESTEPACTLSAFGSAGSFICCVLWYRYISRRIESGAICWPFLQRVAEVGRPWLHRFAVAISLLSSIPRAAPAYTWERSHS